MFKKRVEVANPQDSSKNFEAEFGIDTDVLYSLIPQNLLAQIDNRLFPILAIIGGFIGSV